MAALSAATRAWNRRKKSEADLHDVDESTASWNVDTTCTIIDWIALSNLNVFLLQVYIGHLKQVLQTNTLWSLLVSSITSTVSITQFTLEDTQHPELTLAIKFVIFLSSLITTLLNGYIKVQKIQEKLETVEDSRKSWHGFMLGLISELQVSPEFRKHAPSLINAKKEELMVLQSKNVEMPESVRKEATLELMNHHHIAKAGIATNLVRETKSVLCCRSSCCRRRTARHRSAEASWVQSRNMHKSPSPAQAVSRTIMMQSPEVGQATSLHTPREHQLTAKEFMHMTRKKLRLYDSVSRILRHELRRLVQTYPDEIREMYIYRTTDVFGYELFRKDNMVLRRSLALDKNLVDSYVSLHPDHQGGGAEEV